MRPGEGLREAVFRANLELVEHGLVLLTWGNASGIDREQGIVYIKPSGVPYSDLRAEHIVGVRLADGSTVGDAPLKPSSDTATHLALYRAWPDVGGIVHTHSEYATAVAQACAPIPAQGTTHADYFATDIPCTRQLTAEEVGGDYEAATGAVIIGAFAAGIDRLSVPGVLVAQHAPFAWGRTAAHAVYHAVVLERLARMCVHTAAINPHAARVPQYLLDKHHQRKHGPAAYYGQPKR